MKRRRRLSSWRPVEEQLVRAACEGVASATVQLLDKMRPWLVAYARTQGGPDQADDLVQEISVEIIRALRECEPTNLPEHFEPWARAIARNTVRDMKRQLRVQADVIIDSELIAAAPSRQTAPAEQLALLAALESLYSEHRELLIRRYVLEEQLDEIAHELQIPRTTLVRRLAVAETEFRRRLGDSHE